jgi:hypothetical protein
MRNTLYCISHTETNMLINTEKLVIIRTKHVNYYLNQCTKQKILVHFSQVFLTLDFLNYFRSSGGIQR